MLEKCGGEVVNCLVEYVFPCKGKGKGKGHPGIGHEGPEEE